MRKLASFCHVGNPMLGSIPHGRSSWPFNDGLNPNLFAAAICPINDDMHFSGHADTIRLINDRMILSRLVRFASSSLTHGGTKHARIRIFGTQ